MRSIQEVGVEILGKTPKSFYVFCGSEYGIKMRYLDMLLRVYPNKVEYPSVAAALSFFETKHIVAPEPAVYVIRYDQEFIKELDANTSERIARCKIRGCIVCLYQDEKSYNKLEKYLPTYSVSIDTVSDVFLSKYLHTDFPKCPDRFINIAIELSSDYFQASAICRALTSIPVETLYQYDDEYLKHLFGGLSNSSEQDLKIGIASRNFAHTIKLLDSYDGDQNNIIYSIMATMIELEKVQVSPYTQSVISQYAKRWTREDIYNMFMQSYKCIVATRTGSVDIYNMIVYLLSLMQFTTIPAVEVL